AQRAEHLAALALAGCGAELVPFLRELAQLPLVRGALGLDRRARALEPRLPFFGWRAARPPLPNLVELFVQREHFFEKRRRHLLRRIFRALRREPFQPEEILDPGDRIAQRSIRVVQVRRSLEAGAPLGRRRVVEIIRMELAAE